MKNCLLGVAEQRLIDAGSFWKRAHKSYFDPDEFRRNIQSSIQSLRSVTWVLQNEKNNIPNFESWYSKKQEIMRQDIRLRWLVNSRNKIEKQGDLNTKSKLTIEYFPAWDRSEVGILDLPPRTRPKNIINAIASQFPASKCTQGAILKLSREWIDSELPEEELLSLLTYVYSFIHSLLVEGHQLVNEQRDFCRFYLAYKSAGSHLPKEMTKIQFPAVCWFSLQQGVLKEYQHLTKKFSLKYAGKTAKDRYNLESKINSTDSFKIICEKLFNIGKIMLQKDGCHIMTALVLTSDSLHPFQFRPQDRDDKHIMMRELASSCTRLRAIACILIGEVWMATPSLKYGPYAINYPDRKEALSLIAFHKDEGYFHLDQTFERSENSITFPEKENILKGKNYPGILLPVAEALTKLWGL